MSYLLILLAVSLAVSGLGWIYFICFFSIVYVMFSGARRLEVRQAVTYPSAFRPYLQRSKIRMAQGVSFSEKHTKRGSE